MPLSAGPQLPGPPPASPLPLNLFKLVEYFN
jgi:hypothetical protein